VRRLNIEGYASTKAEHHRYDTPTGDLIMKWLKKEWETDQKTIELIITSDKQNQQNCYSQLEIEGCQFLILDRYTLSQFAYGQSNGMDLEWLAALQRYIRKPDIDIVIDIPADVSMNRKGKHNDGVNDRYESDYEMLNRVRDNYILLDEKYSAPLKFIVDGQRTIEDIHEDIYHIVKDHLLE